MPNEKHCIEMFMSVSLPISPSASPLLCVCVVNVGAGILAIFFICTLQKDDEWCVYVDRGSG